MHGSFFSGFIVPIRFIGTACIWHPGVSLFLGSVGAAICWFCVCSLSPLWLALSLSGLAVLSALSLVPVAVTLLLPFEAVDKRMANDRRFMWIGGFLCLFLVGAGSCLFITPLWVGASLGLLCFLIGFPLSHRLATVLSIRVSRAAADLSLVPSRVSNGVAAEWKAFTHNRPAHSARTPTPATQSPPADRERKEQTDSYDMMALLPTEDRAYWQGRLSDNTLSWMQDIARSYFTGLLPDGSPRPRGKDEERALACYQKIFAVNQFPARSVSSAEDLSAESKLYQQDVLAEAQLHLAILSKDLKPEAAYAWLESAAQTETERLRQSLKKPAICILGNLEVVQVEIPVIALPQPCIREKVAELYSEGWQGMPRNTERAIHWYQTMGKRNKVVQLKNRERKLAFLMGMKEEKSPVSAFFKDPNFDRNLLSLLFETGGLSLQTEKAQWAALERRITEAESSAKTQLLITMSQVERLKKEVGLQRDAPEKDTLWKRVIAMEAELGTLKQPYLSRLILPEDHAYWSQSSFKDLTAAVVLICQIAKSYFINQYPDGTPRSGKINPAYSLLCYGEILALYHCGESGFFDHSCDALIGTLIHNMGMSYSALAHAFADQVPQQASKSKGVCVRIPNKRDEFLDKATLYKIARNRVNLQEYAVLATRCFAATCQAFDKAAELNPDLRGQVAEFFASGNPPCSIERAIHWYRAAGKTEQAAALEQQKPAVTSEVQRLTQCFSQEKKYGPCAQGSVPFNSTAPGATF